MTDLKAVDKIEANSIPDESSVSICPSGEAFPLPREDDYKEELKRLQGLVNEQRLMGREIVVVMGVGFVGAVMAPLAIPVFSLLMGQKSVSASPLGSPATTKDMLEFCTHHDIAPKIEVFPMSKVNEALDHLKAGKARYRIVLENDL